MQLQRRDANARDERYAGSAGVRPRPHRPRDADVDYTLASDDGWIDVAVAAGETYTWQADGPGVFDYYDGATNAPLGTIVVSRGGAITPAYFDGRTIETYFADSWGGCHGSER